MPGGNFGTVGAIISEWMGGLPRNARGFKWVPPHRNVCNPGRDLFEAGLNEAAASLATTYGRSTRRLVVEAALFDLSTDARGRLRCAAMTESLLVCG